MSENSVAPPIQAQGYAITRFNALRHGVLSKHTVLPWEDADEYRALVEALVAEHGPYGPTEEHLVEELAGIFWRKRRMRLAEAAAYRRGLEQTLSPHGDTVKLALVHLDASDQIERVVDAIRATRSDTADEIAEMEQDQAMTNQALEILGGNRNDAYEAALAALREDTRDWWQRMLGDDPEEIEGEHEPCQAEAGDLRRFLEDEVLTWFETRRKELSNRPLIQEQAYGEAFDSDKLEQLGRYEVHLDRKLERTLAMLIRLKQLRQPENPA